MRADTMGWWCQRCGFATDSDALAESHRRLFPTHFVGRMGSAPATPTRPEEGAER